MRTLASALPVAITAAAIIAGCAGTASKPATPEAQVRARAEARWDALLKREWLDAYGYFTPGHRSTVGEDVFIKKMREKRIKWEQARVLNATCPQERVCEVKVEVDYLMHQPLRAVDLHRGTRSWTETWIRVRDQWYYRPLD